MPLTIYQLKRSFQDLLRPLTQALARLGVTANQVTVAALLLSAATGAAVAMFPASRAAMFAVPAVLFVRMALNAIDGMLAREHNMKSSLGAILNELGDVVSDACLYLPLAALPGIEWPAVSLVVLMAALTEMTGVVAVQIGASRRYDGPMGKSDRAFVFGVLFFLFGLGLDPAPWINVVLAAASGLMILTVVNRARGALKEAAR